MSLKNLELSGGVVFVKLGFQKYNVKFNLQNKKIIYFNLIDRQC